MSLINQVASTATKPRSLGGKDQKLIAPIKTFFLAKGDFSFASQSSFESSIRWETGVLNKNIVPVPHVEAPENANKEATIKEARWRDHETKEGVSGVKYRIDASNTFYAAFKTYKNSGYNRVFLTSTLQEHMCDVAEDGKIYGRPFSSMLISMFMEATDDDVSHFFVTFKFDSDEYNTRVTPFEATDIEGIHEVVLTSVSDSTTSRKFTCTSVSTGEKITTFGNDSFINKDETGAVTSPTYVPIDPNTGIYEFTGTFAVGHTLELNGVIVNPTIKYEGVNVLTQS
ncbi:MAG: hypothetical protein MK105_15175 [Crocinitomicaceae bacterium]|nr:hypothetical protein [Crocinitomicaceae bacterium]